MEEQQFALFLAAAIASGKKLRDAIPIADAAVETMRDRFQRQRS